MMDIKVVGGVAVLALILVLFGTFYLGPSDSQGDDMDAIIIDGSGEMDVKVGQEFTVGLHGNATTGYDWILTSDGGVTLVGDRYQADDPGIPLRAGVGGVHYFTLKVDQAGTYEITFDYQRGWIGSEGNVTVLKINAQ